MRGRAEFGHAEGQGDLEESMSKCSLPQRHLHLKEKSPWVVNGILKIDKQFLSIYTYLAVIKKMFSFGKEPTDWDL